MIPGRPSEGIGRGDGDGGQRTEVVDGTGEEESVESVEGARKAKSCRMQQQKVAWEVQPEVQSEMQSSPLRLRYGFLESRRTGKLPICMRLPCCVLQVSLEPLAAMVHSGQPPKKARMGRATNRRIMAPCHGDILVHAWQHAA
jgi:hypothetical protein